MSAIPILLSAGEASGDMYAARLATALKERADVALFGMGGPQMRAAGVETIVDYSEVSVVGITEVLKQLPSLRRAMGRLVGEAERRRPPVAILTDFPGFHLRLARKLTPLGIRNIYYICPQFWAWRQGRVRLLRKYINKTLVIFPFEEKFYRDRGVNATFVGHPLADISQPAISRTEYASKYKLDATKHWITLMPGSRIKEVRMNLPAILESAAKLGSEYEFLLPVAPTLERTFLEPLIGAAPVHMVSEALPALAHSRAGIIASGTATVEAAMMGTPFVMVYRVSPLTYFLGRSRVKIPYFAMVNLIAGRAIVPELVQKDFTADKVVNYINQILSNGPVRDSMIAGLSDVKTALRGCDNKITHPVDRAAAEILDFLPIAAN